MSDIDITRLREILATCRQCGRTQRLPLDWQDIMRQTAPAGWDGRLRCQNDHDAEPMYLQECITCPRCGRTSYNPNDVKQGYCGYCHWWTADPQLGPNYPG